MLQFVAAVTYDYQRFLVAAPRFEMLEREGRIVKGRSAFGSIFRKGRAQQVKVVREGHGLPICTAGFIVVAYRAQPSRRVYGPEEGCRQKIKDGSGH